MGRQRLQLGGFLCSDGPKPVDTGRGYTVSTMAEDFTTGNPVPVIQEIASRMADGTIAAVTGFDNRTESTFRVELCGDSRALARGEADLLAELGERKRNTLVWVAPDGESEPTAFDVTASWLDRVEVAPGNDFVEMTQRKRTYVVKMICLPWARTVEPVIQSGTPLVPTAPTVLDAGTSTTGWLPAGNAGPYSTWTIGGRTALKIGPQPGRYNSGERADADWYFEQVARKSFTNLSTFLTVDVWFDSANDTYITMIPNAAMTQGPVVVETLPDGWKRHYFSTAGLVGPQTFEWRMVQIRGEGTPQPTPSFSNICARTTAPYALTAKTQQQRFVNQGSQRAPMSLHISHPTDVLKVALVATYVDQGDGFTPGGRRFRASGGTVTPSDTRISGASEPISSVPFRARFPMRMIQPGPYEVLLVGDSLNAIEVTLTNSDLASGIKLRPASLPGYFASAGMAMLPQIPAPPESSGFLDLYVSGGAGSILDEVFLIPRGTRQAAHTVVTGADSHLWLESPSATLPRGALWSGKAADKSNAVSVAGSALPRADHYMERERVLVFVAASGVTSPATLEIRYHPTDGFHSQTRTPS